MESFLSCPITSFDIGYDDLNEELIVSYQKKATNLPILKVKMSEDRPCLKPSYYPGDESDFFEDEIRKHMSPCLASDYFDSVYDSRYSRVPGGFKVQKSTFEEQNGLTEIWKDRYP